MGKPDNPFDPGTIPYRILEGDGQWDEMDAAQIAECLGCVRSSVYDGFGKIKGRLNYTVKRKNTRIRPNPSKNGNIYRIGTKIWKLYEGDWSRSTVNEIAEEIGSTRNTINSYICKISAETGKYIKFVDSRGGARKRKRN